MSSPSKRLAPIVSTTAWCAVLAVSAILRPLQLDEVLQLIGTRTLHVASVFDWLGGSPGSAPIGYLLQWLIVRTAGFSNVIARLPSLAAFLFTVLAVVRIGARAGIRRPAVPALIVAVIPMLFRYSIEGRPYLPAFCLTAVATLLLLQFNDHPDDRPALWRLSVYGLVLASAPLVQGSAASVTLAHVWFVLADRGMRRYRSRQVAILATIALSLVLPVAWSLHMRDVWAQSIVRNGYTFAFTFRAAAGFLKDLTAGGLVCTGLLLIGAVYGYFRLDIPQSTKNLLGLTALISVFGALASDAVAGYFSSPRQAIYCLSGLIVLAAAGRERFCESYPRISTLALGVFAAASLVRDVSVVRSKEDWKAASQMLAQVAREGFCLQPASDITAPLPLYSFFDPSLEMHRCAVSENKDSSEQKVGLVYSIYTPRADRDAVASRLENRGLLGAGAQSSGGTTLERYVKRPS